MQRLVFASQILAVPSCDAVANCRQGISTWAGCQAMDIMHLECPEHNKDNCGLSGLNYGIAFTTLQHGVDEACAHEFAVRLTHDILGCPIAGQKGLGVVWHVVLHCPFTISDTVWARFHSYAHTADASSGTIVFFRGMICLRE